MNISTMEKLPEMVREVENPDGEIVLRVRVGGSALRGGRRLPLASFLFSPPVMLPRSLFRGRSDKYSRRS